MSLFVCAKCGCIDNTATSSYWMLTNEYMVDEFDYAKELCFKGYYYVEVKEQDDKELLEAMGRVVYE